MADAFVQVAPDSSGKLIDNTSLVIAGSTLYRQRVQITGTSATDIAPVTSSGGLAVNVTGGILTSLALVTSLSSGLMYQGTSPWVTLAATSGGAQPVVQSATPWTVVSSTTGGAIAVSTVTSLTSATVFQGLTPWPVVASTTGGSQPVSLQNTLPLSVVASTTGGNVPVSLVVGSTSSLQLVQHTTSGGNQPVSIVVGSTSSLQLVQHTTSGGNQPVSIGAGSTSSLQLIQAATSGGAQPVAQSTTPWLVVASSTGGAQPVIQSATPWTVVASTTGGNAPVFLGNTLPLSVTASTTGGNLPVTVQNNANVTVTAIARATQPGAIADGTVSNATIDTKGRQIVTVSQVRQLITQVFLQLASTCETVLLAGTSGTYHDLMALVISAATSNTIGATVSFKDSSGGATKIILNTGTSVAGMSLPVVVDFDPPWKHSTATSTGSAWTTFLGSAAGTVNVSAQFSDWTS